ncbi:light-harvesting protein [Rhodopseudomonas palustris]|uniref:Antenna complex, alpha/beta subunit n=1 Tax=Rhodopseudomonas palustris (strain BisB18) TaxID=316056 RepID=Q20ZW8_RHOPB
MNQGRIWTVVNPSVGLPLLLGSVAVTVLLVHSAVLSNTTWYPAFFSGKVAVSAPATAPVVAPAKK